MENNRKYKPKLTASRLKSFHYAIGGIRSVIISEPNFKIHIIAALIILTACWVLNLSALEWCLSILIISMVLVAEIINTTIENLCDLIQPEYNERIKVIKDISAAGVLIVSVAASIIGVILFLPKLITCF